MCCSWQSARPGQHVRASEQAQDRLSPEKIDVTSKSPVGDISVVTLIRTDTTLDHSQKAEKVWGQMAFPRAPASQDNDRDPWASFLRPSTTPRVRPHFVSAARPSLTQQAPSTQRFYATATPRAPRSTPTVRSVSTQPRHSVSFRDLCDCPLVVAQKQTTS